MTRIQSSIENNTIENNYNYSKREMRLMVIFNIFIEHFRICRVIYPLDPTHSPLTELISPLRGKQGRFGFA